LFSQLLSGGGKPLYVIDSHDDKLKRASGLAVMADFRLVVADLGNDCLKKFRYK
jgi:tripartite motif-containing protein 2/3